MWEAILYGTDKDDFDFKEFDPKTELLEKTRFRLKIDQKSTAECSQFVDWLKKGDANANVEGRFLVGAKEKESSEEESPGIQWELAEDSPDGKLTSPSEKVQPCLEIGVKKGIDMHISKYFHHYIHKNNYII